MRGTPFVWPKLNIFVPELGQKVVLDLNIYEQYPFCYEL